MANGHGGRRANSGRKAKVTKFGGQIAAAEEKIADHLSSLIGKAFELANGIKASTAVIDPVTGDVMKDPETGEVMVELTYVELPDLRAIQFLYERIAGKAPQEVILTEEGGAIEVNVNHRLQAASELEQWRADQKDQLSSWLNAPPTTPTSSTTTG